MLFENDIVIEDGINYKWGGGDKYYIIIFVLYVMCLFICDCCCLC